MKPILTINRFAVGVIVFNYFYHQINTLITHEK